MLIFSLPVIFGMSTSLKSINGITEKQQVTMHVHAENSNGTTVGRVFKFKSFPNKFGLDCAAVVQNSVILLQTIDDCCDQHTLAC